MQYARILNILALFSHIFWPRNLLPASFMGTNVDLSRHLRRRLPTYIVRLEKNGVLAKAISASVNVAIELLYAPLRERKPFEFYARAFSCYSLEPSNSQKHRSSRFLLPATSVWHTRCPRTPHQEHPSTSRAVVSCEQLQCSCPQVSESANVQLRAVFVCHLLRPKFRPISTSAAPLSRGAGLR